MSDVQVEMLDHTGDAGFRVTAGSLPRLFTACAEEMVRLVCPAGTIRRSVARPIIAAGEDLAELLVNWLTEINSLMAVHHELYGAFHIDRFETGDPQGEAGDPEAAAPAAGSDPDADPLPCRVTGSAQGEPMDPVRHQIDVEIKAVTFHQAFVRALGDRWQGQVIFDL